MSFINFISNRFNCQKTLPHSIRVMRIVSIAGISISVAALIIATSVGRGFEKEYVKALLEFNSHLVVMSGAEIDDPGVVIDKLAKNPELGIEGITPFVYREALAIGGGAIKGVVIKGIDTETLADVNRMKIELSEDVTLKDALKSNSDGTISVISGISLHDFFGGTDDVKLMIPERADEAFVRVAVAGSFESGIFDYDSQFILMSLPQIRKLFKMDEGSVTGFELKLKDPLKSEVVARKVEDILGARYQTTTWQELNEDIIAAVNLEKFASSIIMGIMVVVAALNIVAVLVLTTIYRLHEISVLRAIGLSKKYIQDIFVRAGTKISFVGTMIGVGAGLIMAFAIGFFELIPLEAEIYLIKSLPIDISIPICGMIAILCIGIGFLTSVLASRKLANEQIASGLNRAR